MCRQVGDVSKAVCARCQAVVETTFVLRDVPLSTGSFVVSDVLMIPNVLVAVCSVCDSVVAVPAQSTQTIKAFVDSLSDR